jgi:hypothetical protein
MIALVRTEVQDTETIRSAASVAQGVLFGDIVLPPRRPLSNPSAERIILRQAGIVKILSIFSAAGVGVADVT